MNRNTVLSFVDQASARINDELARIPVTLGEVPIILTGQIAGRAVDFLQQNKVPVTGYNTQEISIILSHTQAGEIISKTVPLPESSTHAENQHCLCETIQEFRAEHNALPKQTVSIAIQFLYDEAQITE